MKLDRRYRHKLSWRCCFSAVSVSVAVVTALVVFIIPALSGWWYDRRCLQETANMAPSVVIDGTTKKGKFFFEHFII